MACTLRVCLAVEVTARGGSLWLQSVLRHVVAPLLALLEAAEAVSPCELALVLFGAHPPHSQAAVESCLGWCRSTAELRRLLDDLEFCGGAGQPVALAEALLEAAGLFADRAAGGAASAANHCLVCLASDPAVHPVPWPFAEDCCMANLPGLVTSVELCRAFQRRGIQLGLAGGGLLSTSHLLWHVVNLLADAPVGLAEARLDQLRLRQEAALQRLQRSGVTLPGGITAVLPSWQQLLEVLQAQPGAKPLPELAPAKGGGEGLEPVPPDTEDSAAKARGGAPATQPAAAAAAAPAPAPPPVAGSVNAGYFQSTPPVLPQPTPPVAEATPPPGVVSPGSFWEVLNAQICSPEAMGTPMVQAGMMETQAAMQQQGMAEPAAMMQQPAVPGLPLPPVQQVPPMQQAPLVQQVPPMQQAPLVQQVPPMQQAPLVQQVPPPQQQHQPQRQVSLSDATALTGMGNGAVAQPGMLQQMPMVQQSHVSQAAESKQQRGVLLHTAKCIVDSKVTRGNMLYLGIGQVLGLQQDVPLLGALHWPPELHVNKTITQVAANQFLNSRPKYWRTRLIIPQYASEQAQKFPELLLSQGAVGIISMQNGMTGVLMPGRTSASPKTLLQLVLVPGSA